MRCSVCANESGGSPQHFVWIEEQGALRPYMNAELLAEWLSRSLTKHAHVSIDQARSDAREALFSGRAEILSILQATIPQASSWRIVYDFVCNACSSMAVKEW